MIAIIKKELGAYFRSPVGYVFLASFFLLSGVFFSSSVLETTQTDIASVCIPLANLFSLLIPLLTMKLFSEEKKQKTDQLLLTAPVSLFAIVFGKFLSTLIIFSIGASITVVFLFVISTVSNVMVGVAISNLLGLLLLGASFISIGLFISSLTENQVVSVVVTIVTLLLLSVLDIFSALSNNQNLVNVQSTISFMDNFHMFSRGIFGIGNTIFFLSIISVFLFLTHRVLEKKRWS